MSTITLRATKGSPLTNTEVDTNFSNLNTDKLEATYAGAMNSLTGGSSITTVSSTTGITTGAWKATAIGAAYGGTGVANNAANTITFTGAYSLGLTLSGATSVTLPTSGTLATLAGSETLTNKTLSTSSTWNGNVIGTAYGGTGVANGTNNTITFTGNYTLGLTLSGNTSVTLPTSGTLVNTAVTTLSSLASIGTITTGTWNGSTIGVAYGGTGLTTLTAGYIPYGNGTGALSSSANLQYVSGVLQLLGTTPGISISSTSGIPYTQVASSQASGYYPSQLNLVRTGTTLSSPTPASAAVGEIRFAGNDSAGAYANFAMIQSSLEGSNASGGAAASMVFYTGVNGGTATQKLLISSAGGFAFGGGGYGTSGQLLQSNGNASPTWITPTYASTGKAIAMAMVFGG